MPLKPLRVPVGQDYPDQYISELGVYAVQADAQTSTNSTEEALFSIPANTLIVGIGYEVTTAFTNGSRAVNAALILGDTSDSDRYARLGTNIIGSTNSRGYIPMNEDVTSAINMDAAVTTYDAEALSQGSVDIWVYYRPVSNTQKWAGT